MKQFNRAPATALNGRQQDVARSGKIAGLNSTACDLGCLAARRVKACHQVIGPAGALDAAGSPVSPGFLKCSLEPGNRVLLHRACLGHAVWLPELSRLPN